MRTWPWSIHKARWHSFTTESRSWLTSTISWALAIISRIRLPAFS